MWQSLKHFITLQAVKTRQVKEAAEGTITYPGPCRHRMILCMIWQDEFIKHLSFYQVFLEYFMVFLILLYLYH